MSSALAPNGFARSYMPYWQYGQGMTEYLVLLAFFSLALLSLNNQISWHNIVDALVLAYRRLSFALSVAT